MTALERAEKIAEMNRAESTRRFYERREQARLLVEAVRLITSGAA